MLSRIPEVLRTGPLRLSLGSLGATSWPLTCGLHFRGVDPILLPGALMPSKRSRRVWVYTPAREAKPKIPEPLKQLT